MEGLSWSRAKNASLIRRLKNMEGRSRYNISAKGAGIDSGVLKNKLGIKNQKALEDAETLLLSDAYVHFSRNSRRRILISTFYFYIKFTSIFSDLSTHGLGRRDK